MATFTVTCRVSPSLRPDVPVAIWEDHGTVEVLLNEHADAHAVAAALGPALMRLTKCYEVTEAINR